MRKSLLVLLLAVTAYYGIYCYSLSFPSPAGRVWCVADDVYITAQYGRTFAETGKAVWYPGAPRVQGYTSPAWMLVSAGIHRLFRPTAEMFGFYLQVLGLACLLATVLLTYRLAVRFTSRTTALVSAGLVGFYWPLVNLMAQGWEHAVLVPLTLAAVVLALGQQRQDWRVILLLGLGVLVRLDYLVVAIPILLWALLTTRDRVGPVLAIVGLLGLAAGVCAVQKVVYGSFLPCPVVLKMVGYPLLLRLSRGGLVTLQALGRVALPVGLVLWFTVAQRRLSWWFVNPGAGLVAPVFLGLVFFSALVGGDAWETDMWLSRYLLMGFPLILALLPMVISLNCKRDGAIISTVLSILVLLLSTPLTQQLLIEKPVHYQKGDYASQVTQAWYIRRYTTENARVAVVSAGIIPYFSRRPAVDFLGCNDRRIARHAPRERKPWPACLAAFYPGHNAWDYRYSIGELKPDVVASVWAGANDAVKAMGKNYGTMECQCNGRTVLMAVRLDSPHILWNEIAASRKTKDTK